jgi:hypothetical protein
MKRNHLDSNIAPMRRMTLLLVGALACVMAPLQALASDITVGSPVNGTHVSSPVLIRALNVGCNGITPTFFGYSIDDDNGIVPGKTPYDIDVTRQALPAGAHTVHFKSWTSNGECPTVSTTFTVNAPGDPSSLPTIPPDAISSGDLDDSDKWYEHHDGGTTGKSKGTTVYPASTNMYDDARKFTMTYTDHAGERWADGFAFDTEATHFVLDTYIYLPNPSEIWNLELDVDQVLANGETIILSTQCSGVHGRWSYGYTVDGRLDHWWNTNLKCNPAEWTANVWHHVQIGEHRDADSMVTHDWVILDGVYNAFEDATRVSGKFIEWTPGQVNTQFQLEGASPISGSATAYVHGYTIYRW